MLLALGACSLPALVASGVIHRASALHGLANSANPYFQPDQAWLLYGLTPLVTVSGLLLFLVPGVLFALLVRVQNWTEAAVFGFGFSLLLCIVLGTSYKLAARTALSPPAMRHLWLASCAALMLMLVVRTRRGEVTIPRFWPEGRRPISMALASLVGVAVLTPKFFWENFNLDGTEAFEFGRSLTTHLLPYWDIQGGVFGFYRNFVLFSYPNHWFISFFGPFEAAARLPYLLYLCVIFGAIVLLAEHGTDRKLSGKEEAALWLGLACYTVVQAFNTNYEPFYADLAENAATDTLAAACFLAACYSLWTGKKTWFWTFALMTFTASPGGLLLLGALGGAVLLARPQPWRIHVRQIAAIVTACLFLGFLYEAFYIRNLPGHANDQFSTFNMLRRLFPPTVMEFARWSAIVFPSGMLPFLSLFFALRKDALVKALTLVTASYFGVMYVQVWTSVHQFTPIMVLPLIVFWRMYLISSERKRRWLLPAVTLSTILSLYLSLPSSFQINTAAREFGLATAYQVGDYETAYEEAARAAGSLKALLPDNYRLMYPNQPWGTDPFVWLYYATRPKPPGAKINYVVLPASEPAPGNTTRVSDEDNVAVYVYDREVWQRDRNRQLPQITQSPLYEPVLRRTYQFFREYRQRTRMLEPNQVREGQTDR